MPETPIEDILDDARAQMKKAVEHLRSELRHIRTGRATPAMLDGVKVDYYGTLTPLDQVASISAPAPDLLVVQPFDPGSIEDIEKGIMKADLGLNPNNDGNVIRVPIPPLSEERRKELANTVSERGEKTRIAIRNIRRTAREDLKETQQEKNLSEDVYYSSEEDLQEITDQTINQVDQLVERKEEELLKV
jgi:ribosome recycling factor